MKMENAILMGALMSLSSSLYALDCVDASGKSPGAFKAISVDESAGKVILVSYLYPDEPTELTLIRGPGSDMAYNFNDQFTEKKGARYFKLFYIKVWDEWRMIDSIIMEESGEQVLLGVSSSIAYSCK